MSEKQRSTLTKDLSENDIINIHETTGFPFETYHIYDGINRTWEQYRTRLAEHTSHIISSSDTIVDIGAHQGIFSFHSARLGARVISIEPDPMNVESLKRNLELNPGFDIVIEQAAVYSKCGVISFNCGKTLTTGALLASNRDWKRTENNIEVETLDFDEILNRYSLNDITIMKIDCEGGEYDFLFSTSVENIKRVKYFALEVHPTQDHAVGEINDFFENIGYQIAEYDAGCKGCKELIVWRK